MPNHTPSNLAGANGFSIDSIDGLAERLDGKTRRLLVAAVHHTVERALDRQSAEIKIDLRTGFMERLLTLARQEASNTPLVAGSAELMHLDQNIRDAKRHVELLRESLEQN